MIISECEADVLIYLLDLVDVRLKGPVGCDESVHTEVAGAWSTLRSKVSAICPVESSVLCLGVQALIHPVPYMSALKRRVCLDYVPIVLEVTYAVAHCVCVFAEDERLLRQVQCMVDENVDLLVHRAVDVGIRTFDAVLRMYRTL